MATSINMLVSCFEEDAQNASHGEIRNELIRATIARCIIKDTMAWLGLLGRSVADCALALGLTRDLA